MYKYIYIYIYLFVCVYTQIFYTQAYTQTIYVYLPTPLHAVLNWKFSFSKYSYHTKVKEPSLPYCLFIAGGRIIGYMPFPRVLALCEMQTSLFRIWTQVAVSISYDDGTLSTSK